MIIAYPGGKIQKNVDFSDTSRKLSDFHPLGRRDGVTEDKKRSAEALLFFGGEPYGNFIKDEYTHTLRLESELSDLRVGYADNQAKRGRACTSERAQIAPRALR